MPHRDATPTGAPCWIDLYTADPDASRAFYTALFGWTAADPDEEFGGYVSYTKDGRYVAGSMRNDETTGTPDLWSVYLASDNTEKTVEIAVANGGTVIVPAMVVGDHGTMAVVTDPGGASIGIWQPDRNQGLGVLGEPGTPAWFELHTRDYDASVAFYRTVFGWDTYATGDTADIRYTTLGDGDNRAAGIMDASAFLPDGVPAHWSVYFGVADTDAALAKIVALGGAVVRPAEDTPYGRLAEATDPTGASFKLTSL